MTHLTRSLGLFALTLSALIFGFFYAWTCSTMWGLDAADPRIAVAAMQAMNASVRNAVFAPAFFGTAPALLAVAILARNQRPAALLFLAASITYGILGMGLTLAINVPMNQALARLPVPEDMQAAAAIWADYSPRWQVWNQVRTVTSGLAFLLAALGYRRLA